MLFIRKPQQTPKEYVLLSPLYGLNDPDDDVPLMTRRDALSAARYFLAMIDDPDAKAQVVNTNNNQIYTVQAFEGNPNAFLVTWLNGNC